jgi:hypothetical protein
LLAASSAAYFSSLTQPIETFSGDSKKLVKPEGLASFCVLTYYGAFFEVVEIISNGPFGKQFYGRKNHRFSGGGLFF